MNQRLYALVFLFFASLLSFQCKDPLDGVRFEVDGAQVIKYSAVFEVAEANGGSLAGLSVAIAGEDAAAVYDLGGKKNFALYSGMLSLGIDPRYEPRDGDPLRFEVIISGAGFITERIPVTIASGQLQQLKKVAVMREATPPASGNVINTSHALSGDATPQAISISTPLNNGAAESMSITIPAGTKFKDAEGRIIAGTSLSVSVLNFNMANPEATDHFPGGSLISDEVLGVGGEALAATFLPAAFANIEMRVAGVQVRSFSLPLTISMGINPNYQNDNTGRPVKAGDQLPVYSYESGSGKWTYEKVPAVSLLNGKMQVAFTTDHLTWYMTGVVLTTPKPAVKPNLEITFLAPWLKGADQPVNLKLKRSGCTVKQQMHALRHNGKLILNGIMPGNYTVEVWDHNKKLLYTGPLTVPAGSNVKVTFEIVSPEVIGPLVSMELKISCPDKNALITPPDFYLYYSETTGPVSYRLLGLVSGGVFTTRLLDLNKRYHFKAVWGDKTKIVLDRQVSTENMLVVNKNNAGKGGCGCAEAQVTMFLEECGKW